MPQTDDTPKAHFTPAEIGDLVVVELHRGAWVIGEVVSVTKEHSRVRRILLAKLGEQAVGPHQHIRVAAKRQLHRRRAFHLWMSAPDNFPTWNAACTWLTPARLRPGEATDDWESAPLSALADHPQAQEESDG